MSDGRGGRWMGFGTSGAFGGNLDVLCDCLLGLCRSQALDDVSKLSLHMRSYGYFKRSSNSGVSKTCAASRCVYTCNSEYKYRRKSDS